MLSFATEFPVENTDSDRFVDAVRKWMIGSPHTAFSEDELSGIPSEGRWKVEVENARLEAMLVKGPDVQTTAFRHTVTSDHIEWITEVTYSKTSTDDWVGVRTARESSRPLVTLPPAKKPLLVRTLISELGGGLDDELFVRDKPHYLSEQDVRMAVRLLNADAENYLPIIYFSSPFDGIDPINPVPLARVLGGMAHIVVEPSRDFSRKIQPDVGSRNVYGGRVGVYWPSGEQHRYFLNAHTPTDFDVRQLIAADIRAAHINRRPLGRCTWSRAEAETARTAFELLQSAGSDDVSEYVAVFDSELRAKNQQLIDAELEVSRLKGQVRSLEARTTSEVSGWNHGSEQQLRDGEFEEILKDALNAASANAQDGSRRQHVLGAFATGIPNVDVLRTDREKLKAALKDYRSMNSSTKSDLKGLGFDITEDGKHYKLIYMQDERYVFAVPKSGSDWRGGMNLVSDIGKRVF